MADNEELREYITEMVLLISSGDEAADEAAIDMAAHNIHAKSVQVFEEYKASLKASLKEIKDELLKQGTDESRASQLVDQQVRLSELLAEFDQPPDREETVQYLKNLRAEFMAKVAEGGDSQKLAQSMSGRLFDTGLETVNGASLVITSAEMAAAV